MPADARTVRLNAIMSLLADLWPEPIPLDISDQAAQAAERIVTDWFAQVDTRKGTAGDQFRDTR